MTTTGGQAAHIGMNPAGVRSCIHELDGLLARLAAVTAQLGATRISPTDYSASGSALAAAANAKQTEIVSTLVKLAGLITAKRQTLEAAVTAVERHDEQTAVGYRNTGGRLDRTWSA
jgi:ABC-type transporter Mla subunit MlaD